MNAISKIKSILRSLFGASIALSIALSGVQPAGAVTPPPQITPHFLQAGPAMADLNLGFNAGFTLGDVDGDGDTDALVGTNRGKLLYYPNGGGPNIGASFFRQRDDLYPIGLEPENIDYIHTIHKPISYAYVQPELIDVNSDGRMDLFVAVTDRSRENTGEHKLIVDYFQYTKDGNYFLRKGEREKSTPSIVLSPSWMRVDAIQQGYTVDESWMSFAAGDINKDGLLDSVVTYIAKFPGGGAQYRCAILMGQQPGLIENAVPVLISNFSAQPYELQYPTERSYPELFDIDSDGDLDLLVGTAGGVVKLYRNNFTAGSPATVLFTQVNGPNHPLNPANAPAAQEGPDFGAYVVPEFGNLDIDSFTDFAALSSDGLTYVMGYDISKDVKRYVFQANPNDFLAGLDAGPRDVENDLGVGAVTFADLDGDGDKDALTGGKDGIIRNYENRLVPDGVERFVQRTGSSRWVKIPANEQYSSAWTYVTPVLVNLDRNLTTYPDEGDLDYDLVISVKASACAQPGTTALNGLEQPIETPADLDKGDGVTRNNGTAGFILCYYENEDATELPALPSAPAFVLKDTPGDDPFEGITFDDTYLTPTFVDVDGDDWLDMVFGTANGALRYYWNFGDNLLPRFQSVPSDPITDIGVNLPYAAPTFADVDHDNDPDLVIGRQNGAITYYRNDMPNPEYYANPDCPGAGCPSAAVGPFTLQTAKDNPFDFLNTGGFAAPALADLDNDGDLDLASGSFLNAFRYFENIAPVVDGVRVPAFRDYRYNPLAVVEPGDYNFAYKRSVNFVDFEGDGDQDAFVGADETNSKLAFYLNIGTPQIPVFRKQADADNPFSDVVSPNNLINVGFGDTHIESDPDDPHRYEAYVGGGLGGDGWLKAYDYDPVTGKYLLMSANPFESSSIMKYMYTVGPRAVLHDFDGDNFDDLVFATGYWPSPIDINYPTFNFYFGINQVGNLDYRFELPTDAGQYADFYYNNANPFRQFNRSHQIINTDKAYNATLVDEYTWWMGNEFGTVATYTQSLYDSDSQSYALERLTEFRDPFKAVSLPGPTLPTAADMNGDGMPEAFVASSNGTIHFFIGSSTPPPAPSVVYLPVVLK